MGIAIVAALLPGGVPAHAAPAQVTTAKAAVRDSSKMAFNLPQTAHTKLVFAHYWPPEPLWLGTTRSGEDYLDAYTRPLGVEGDFYDTGGHQRDRSLPTGLGNVTATRSVQVPAAVGGAVDVNEQQIRNMAVEIERAASAGIDGFALNLFNLSDLRSDNGPRELAMLLAAANYSNFKIMLQPDMSIVEQALYCDASVADQYRNATTGKTKCIPTPDVMAQELSTMIDLAGGSIYTVNNKVVISPFISDQDATGAAYWAAVMAKLNATHAAVLWPVFVFPQTISTYAKATPCYGTGWWGSRSPDAIATTPALAKSAHASGLKWMGAVSVQDARPNAAMTPTQRKQARMEGVGSYREAGGTATLRASWTRATTGKVDSWVQSWINQAYPGRKVKPVVDDPADMVLLPTWNDYTESTAFSPSLDHGWSVLDISAYYATRFQTGSAPKIIRNAVYVANRVQLTGVKPKLAGTSTTSRSNGVLTYNRFQSYDGTSFGLDPAEGPKMRTKAANAKSAKQKKAAAAFNKASYALANRVEVLAMLTQDATIKVSVGSKVTTFAVPKGVHAYSVPLGKGAIKVQVFTRVTKKNKKAKLLTAVAARDLLTAQQAEDLSYHFRGSLR